MQLDTLRGIQHLQNYSNILTKTGYLIANIM